MSRDLLTALLCAPQGAAGLSLAQWDGVLRLARSANLISRLAFDLKAQGLLEAVPPQVRAHLIGALTVAERQKTATLAEVEHVRAALAEGGIRLVLLKGAAYLAAGLPVARGRVFGDIDLLVPRAQLPEAESVLLRNGWVSSHLDAYDQRYYRTWMHELPPVRHLRRDSVLDIHHNILPLSSRQPPDAARLLEEAVAVSPGVFVLAPVDMVLHSACHLFHEGELEKGLRDLLDLDGLIRHFGSAPDFWPRIAARAEALHLARPLRYALAMCRQLLATPLPASAQALAGDWPRGARETLLDQAYRRALRPHHPLADDFFSPLARALLYLRGHWLRMPPLRLLAHLSRKAWLSWTGLDGSKPTELKKDPGV
ncbi:nucleotidyltransferase family protein [Niveibacterium terrae]|uniref:nucleotidyltransferase domain-containing protein n=1 Tax=Niveibacterium terrae TaxID=3373598 RepID=UPI003A93FCB9